MKKLLTMVMIVTSAGLACAGETETTALNAASLTGVNISAMRAIDVPAAPAAVKVTSSASWIKAVKKEYLRLLDTGNIQSLPAANISELPDAAKQQLKEDNTNLGPDYPSIAYKMELQGATAFIIHNENDGGMFTTIFDEIGQKIAEGSCGESGEFSWDTSKGAAIRKTNALAAVKGTPTYMWVKAVKKEYLRLFNEGNLGTLPVAKISELPADAKQQLKADNTAWGPEYPSIPYKMVLQGMTAFIIHNENDDGMFVAIFDKRGNYIAAGFRDNGGTFAWDDI